MALPNDIEEILSDDYEEGEILEDDSLYEDVSSLEEFDCEKVQPVIQGVPSDIPEKSDSVPKNHRKKEHRCKEDSVCRKERKGKHCYARIRKEKPSHKIKTKETVENVYDYGYKKIEIIRVPSPPGRLRMDYVKPNRYEYKDYHEKENRNSNKKYWNCKEDLSRSRYKHPVEKPIDRGRTGKDSRSKYSNYSSSSSGHRTYSGSKFDSSKTSLLKRLVGSGNSGVKTIKDDTSISGGTVQPGDTPAVPPVEPSKHPETESKSTENDNIDQCFDNKLSAMTDEVTSPDENIKTETLNTQTPEENKSDETLATEVKKKGIGLVWKRSIKDDRDELHLRVEALKSAWIKKFSERKKRGLLNQKKSSGPDDSLDDFVLGSSCSSGEDEKEEVCTSSNFNSTDLSGDILKPEDMVIVQTNDTSHQEPIILEPALQIGVPLACESTVFIPSTLIQLPDSEQQVPNREVGSCMDMAKPPLDPIVCESTEVNDSAKSFASTKSHESPTPRQSVASSNASNSRSAKIKRKKARRKARKEAKRKSLIELDEERILRENALMSLKIKSKTVASSLPSENNEHINHEESKQGSSNVQVIPLEGIVLPSSLDSKLSESKIICESEVNGAISSDNLDDDIDEDILRAQLLSSLTKQVTDTELAPIGLDSQLEIRTQTVPINVMKKQTKKHLKNPLKRVWGKAGSVETKMMNAEIKCKGNVQQYPNKNKVKKNRILGQVGGPPVRVSPIPKVEKFIISVNDSDSSSSDMEFGNEEPERTVGEDLVSKSLAAKLEADIDLLLQEAKRNTQFGKVVPEEALNPDPELVLPEATSLEHVPEENQCAKSTVSGTPNLTGPHPSETVATNATPQALKHLPAWQQEEYRRLKQKIAEKERVLQEVSRAKVVELEEQGKVRREGESAGDPPLPPPPTPSSGASLLAAKENIGPPKLDANRHSSDENTQPDKKSFPNIASCSVLEEINVMNDIVNEFDKNNSEYLDLKKKLNRLKKLVKINETKMSVKEKKLREMKESIQKRVRTISSRIESLSISQHPAPEKNKPASRDMELIKLKYKEVSLRAQFLFHDFSTESCKPDGEKAVARVQDGGGLKRPPANPPHLPPTKKTAFAPLLCDKGKDNTEVTAKRSFSVKERERGDWDPNTPVCHYDLTGICKDQECKYQHFKTC